MYAPVGYIFRIKMCEFEDVPDIPLPIPNYHFAALIAGAKKKSDENPLFPTDCLIHLYASAIFKPDSPFFMSDDDDTAVILLEMQMDLENDVHMYHEQQLFTLPTTHDTHPRIEITLEIITKFKDQMLNTLLRTEDHDCQSIWNLYKPHVRPTVSSFDPIYHS
ncbi:hypothetical protein RMATCC62417_10197 [Rhizopus microsporus]|nr:hypothetical protein RMATCC62417_10197 [Rhizopus microsporus]